MAKRLEKIVESSFLSRHWFKLFLASLATATGIGYLALKEPELEKTRYSQPKNSVPSGLEVKKGITFEEADADPSLRQKYIDQLISGYDLFNPNHGFIYDGDGSKANEHYAKIPGFSVRYDPQTKSVIEKNVPPIRRTEYDMTTPFDITKFEKNEPNVTYVSANAFFTAGQLKPDQREARMVSDIVHEGTHHFMHSNGDGLTRDQLVKLVAIDDIYSDVMEACAYSDQLKAQFSLMGCLGVVELGKFKKHYKAIEEKLTFFEPVLKENGLYDWVARKYKAFNEDEIIKEALNTKIK